MSSIVEMSWARSVLIAGGKRENVQRTEVEVPSPSLFRERGDESDSLVVVLPAPSCSTRRVHVHRHSILIRALTRRVPSKSASPPCTRTRTHEEAGGTSLHSHAPRSLSSATLTLPRVHCTRGEV